MKFEKVILKGVGFRALCSWAPEPGHSRPVL